MTRPRCKYNVEFCPKVREFCPAGGKGGRAGRVELSSEEAEAMRLKNVLGLPQIAAAKRMEVSQSTFQRVLSSAYRKVSAALIGGRTLRIAEQKTNNKNK